MNSTKLNMYAAGIIGSLLIFMLLGFFSDLIFSGGHEQEEGPLAYAVEVEDGGEAKETAEAIDWAALVAAADPAKGEKLFGKCKACHKVQDGVNGVGPSLWGVVGRDIATTAGYDFSSALTGLEGDWTLEALSGFLESPKGYAPGTKMGFGGLKKVGDRINLIVYLNQADGSPEELAEASASESTETEAADEADPAAETVEATTEAVETVAAGVTEAVPVPVTEAEAAEAETESAQEVTATGGDSFSELLAAADANAGKKIFRKCRACHKVEEGKNGVGPSLWGVIGRDVASVEGFNYSDAMMAMEGDWTADALFTYLEDPKADVPGTKMRFAGVKDAQDRVNVIVYLNEFDGTPEALQ
jgi:cytochrome c2